MVKIFESAPDWVIDLLRSILAFGTANPMTAILILVIGAAVVYLLIAAAYHRQTQRADRKRSSHIRKPGSFPGDNR